MRDTRRFIAGLSLIATASFAMTPVNAGCLDWLFGHHRQPYAVQYAPVAPAPLYEANYYGANYAPIPPTVTTAAPVSGVYQAQRPAYYSNPSVYTGMPVLVGNQPIYAARPLLTSPAPWASARVPLAGSLRGAASPYAVGSAYASASPYAVASPYSAASPSLTLSSPVNSATTVSPDLNQTFQTVAPTGYSSAYPSYQPAAPTDYSSAYQSYQPATVPTPITGTLPTTAWPTTTTAPMFVNPAPQPPSGLARFFGSLLGRGYRSSYYRAPITYYRPVTNVDPVTGTTVTVQRPCTSYVQQLQRVPMATVHSSPTTIAPAPAPLGCAPQYSSPPMSSYDSSLSSPNVIDQVGGYQSPATGTVTPIPSTQPSYGGAPSYAPSGPGSPAPLSGSPPGSGGDLAPLEPPQLPSASCRSNREAAPNGNNGVDEGQADDAEDAEADEQQDESYWERNSLEDSTARRPGKVLASGPAQQIGGHEEPVRYTQLEPIPAPENYRSPLRQPISQPGPRPSSATSEPFEAPPLSPRTSRPAPTVDASSLHASSRDRTISLRQPVTSERQPVTSKRQPVQRDRSGWRTVSP